MTYTLPPLPYAYDALEPHFDARTMEIHHSRHHQTDVNNLNNAVAEAGIEAVPVEELIAAITSLPDGVRTAIRNNGGGHANHALFWTVLGPDGGSPEGELAEAIDADLGGYDAFKDTFTKAVRSSNSETSNSRHLHSEEPLTLASNVTALLPKIW